MGLRFHRVLNIIPGLVRLNISKTGVSTSVGPRGADVNIGGHGVTTNAGLPGTGLSYRQKVGHHVSGIAVGLFIAALAFAVWRHYGGDFASAVQQASHPMGEQDDSVGIPTVTPAPKGATHTRTHAAAAMAGADVIAAAKPASGVMFVHRNNSDLRDRPSTSSPAIKKLAKGEQVSLIAISDKWAQVQDGMLKGWLRASVIKTTPPGAASAKHPRKKKPAS